jgi:hypothetical protein
MADFDLASAKPVFDVQAALSQTDKALGLPDGFSAAQIKVESGFDPSAVSRRGAMGLAQVMPDTLKVVSQRLGRDLDPMNPADAVQIHREVMRENLARFGTPDKALMAYNGGWDPSKWGNPETRAYVGKVSAAFKGDSPVMAALGKAVGAVMPSAQAGEGFDLSTAKPVPFDLATARPTPAGPTAAARIEADAITQGARNFANDIGPFERAVAGYGTAGADLARGLGQRLGLVSQDEVAERRRLDAPLMATTAGKVGNIAGNLAPMGATALLPGANTLLGGAAIGAVTGLIAPSTSTHETVTNTLLGAGGGAVVPAAGMVYRTARAAAEPFYEAGRNAIVGRALNRAAGQDAPAVAQRLQEAAAPFVGPSQGPVARTTMGELVPGSVPTVGQAAGNPGIAALERAATASNPEVTNAVSQQMQAQNAARVGVLDEMAGTDARRAAAQAAREAGSRDLYQAATRATYTVDPELANLLQRPAVRQAMERARTMAANDGRPFAFDVESRTGLGSLGNQSAVNSRQITGQGLQDLKMAMDAMLTDPASGFVGKAGRQVQDLRSQIVRWMESANPDFRAARTTYRDLSQPLNEMDVAGAIRDRTVSPLTGNLQPGSYARAISDEGLPARATGFPAATIENSVSNASRNSLLRVLDDLQRANAAQNAGRGAGSDTVQKLAYNGLMDQAGLAGTRTGLRVLSGVPVIGRIGSAAGEAYDRASVDLNRRLAEVMLDPAQASRLMTRATPRELNQLLRLAQRGSSALAISAPAAAHAFEQE